MSPSRSPEGQQRRANKLKARITSGDNDHLPSCTVADPVTGKPCGRQTERAAKDGLSAFVCRYHVQFKARHGSHWCKSPSADLLRPYLKAAATFIDLHRSDLYIGAALSGLHHRMLSAGPVDLATRLRGLAPLRKAQIALARLRDAEVKPERLLAIPLAVAALMKEAPGTIHNVPEWRTVAVAKAAHRLASGTHKQWPLAQPDGTTKKIEMHAYPRSSGLVLRHLGQLLEQEAALVLDHHLDAVLALKVTRYGPHPSLGTNVPEGPSAAGVRSIP
jgi:hypothetical protein